MSSADPLTLAVIQAAVGWVERSEDPTQAACSDDCWVCASLDPTYTYSVGEAA